MPEADEIPDDVYPGIQAERVQELNDHEPARGRYVLYWMQQAARAVDNHALEYAIRLANGRRERLLVCFGLTDDYPEASARHYHFLLEGLKDVAAALEKRHVPFVVQRGNPDEVAVRLAERASVVVCDRGYLRHQREWRERLARTAACRVVQVESDVVVPVELVSDKKEFAARTIRPRITRHLDRFLVAVPKARLTDRTRPRVRSEDVSDPDRLLRRLKVDESVPVVRGFTGGTGAGQRLLRRFVKDHLPHYAENRNQPQTDHVSHMSKYLHFGQLSPLTIALAIREHRGENADAFCEELIIRRELPMNFVFYEPQYDRYASLPDFAQQTLDQHADDHREHVYSRAQLEKAETHDPYWNAAMREMIHTGYLHNHMRMYWGKKIIEWSRSPQAAYRTALYLNNKWLIDGRDANSYANIAWVFGQHDRGWTERPIFGKVRYMSASGLERKTDPEAYVAKVERLVAEQTDD